MTTIAERVSRSRPRHQGGPDPLEARLVIRETPAPCLDDAVGPDSFPRTRTEIVHGPASG
jgi:hypothetical protein